MPGGARPSDWWIGLGATLVGAAFAGSNLAVVVGLITLPDYQPPRAVAASLAPERLAVEPGQQYVVLAHAPSPFCGVADVTTHEPAQRLPVAADVDAHVDRGGSWQATLRFVPAGDAVDVQCSPDTAVEVARFDPPDPLRSIRNQWRILLGTLALGLLGASIAALVLRARLRPRRGGRAARSG